MHPSDEPHPAYYTYDVNEAKSMARELFDMWMNGVTTNKQKVN